MAEKTIMDMFADTGKQFNLPKIDFDALLSTHRQDIDAVQKSALALSQDDRTLLARQQEIFTDVMHQSRELIAEFKPRGFVGACGDRDQKDLIHHFAWPSPPIRRGLEARQRDGRNGKSGRFPGRV